MKGIWVFKVLILVLSFTFLFDLTILGMGDIVKEINLHQEYKYLNRSVVTMEEHDVLSDETKQDYSKVDTNSIHGKGIYWEDGDQSTLNIWVNNPEFEGTDHKDILISQYPKKQPIWEKSR